MKCRHCGAELQNTFVDLGSAPPSNAYLDVAQLSEPEHWYPLRVLVCNDCWLVQTEDFVQADKLFTPDYAYFSSTSSKWLAHAESYAQNIMGRLGLSSESLVVEVASNDGYLLKNFVKAGIPCLGIEPTACTAAAAELHGIPVLREFFGEALGQRLVAEGKKADLIIGNNVFAHVPDINDFTRGLKTALKPDGTVTLEFPHLMRLIEFNQFDTIYHEHYSYLSLYTATRIFSQAGLRIWDVEELSTHGGSLRVYGCHKNDTREITKAVGSILAEESLNGLRDLSTYKDFQQHAELVKNDLLYFLIDLKRQEQSVAAYGAAAKGSTLLNFAGIKPDLLPYVCDAAPSKQGKFLPGSRIPILPPEVLRDRRPQTLVVFPWNIVDEIVDQNSFVQEWGGRFVVAVPELKEIVPASNRPLESAFKT